MSLLVNTVQPSPGQYYFGAGVGGGGGGGVTPPPIVIQPVNAPAGGAVAPAITLNTGVGGSNAWVEGLVNQATGSPANSGNDLTFVPHADGGAALPAPAPIVFQRSTGSIIANNVQVQDVVYSPMVAAGSLQLTGGQGFGRIPFNGGGLGGAGPVFASFVPVETGLYVFEGVCSVQVSPTSFCVVPADAFIDITIRFAPAPAPPPNPGYNGGSLVIKPFAMTNTSTTPTGNRGTVYAITANNSILLQAGTTYQVQITTFNPTNVGNTNPGTPQPFGFFNDAAGTTPDITGLFNIYCELYSLCRIKQPYQPGIPT